LPILFDEKTSNIAFQVGGGLSFKLTEYAQLDVSYRVRSIVDPTLKTFMAGIIETSDSHFDDSVSQQIVFGLSFKLR
jgi:opacity protein-like surface antigen